MAQQGTRNVKTDIAIPKERGPSKEWENKNGVHGEGNPNTCFREEAYRGR